MHKPVGRVQFELFDKNTSANYSKLNEKSYDYQLIIFMKKKVICTAVQITFQLHCSKPIRIEYFFHVYYIIYVKP